MAGHPIGHSFLLPLCHYKHNLAAQSLLQLLRTSLSIGQHTVRIGASIGASIGIAVYPEDASDTESLYIAADLRIHEDKHGASIEDPNLQPATRQGSSNLTRHPKLTFNPRIHLAAPSSQSSNAAGLQTTPLKPERPGADSGPFSLLSGLCASALAASGTATTT
ncbi:MAG: hypothetical protein WCE75_14970, partial [Terracidiphilus sp.]